MKKKKEPENDNKLQIQYLDPNTLIPYANNAKIHDTFQITKLASSIHAFGFDQPIVVDKDMIIIKGHGRFLASIQLNMKQVPVIVATHLDEFQVRASRIADNKTSSMKYDNNLLKFDLGTLQLREFDLKLTGLDDVEIDNLMVDFDLNQELPDRIIGEKILDSASKNTNKELAEEWKDMPEYNQQDMNSFRHIIVHFETQADVDYFQSIINQNITDKTKTIWIPPQERHDSESKRYG